MMLGELAARLGCKLESGHNDEVHGVAGIENAKAGEVTFLNNSKYSRELARTLASAVFVEEKAVIERAPDLPPLIAIRSKNPYFDFARAIELFSTPAAYAPEIHPSAVISQFAKIGVKNHRHSQNNPYAQFQDAYTLEQILESKRIYGPLTKLQCSPTSDGSCAVILASEDFVNKHDLSAQAVEIVGQAMVTDLQSTFTDHSAITLVGADVGSPSIAIPGSGSDTAKIAFFGPVVNPAPEGEAAARLWDSTLILVSTPGYCEIKRTRTIGPLFD